MLKFVSRGDAESSASTATADPHPALSSTSTESVQTATADPVQISSASTCIASLQPASGNINTDLTSPSSTTTPGEVQGVCTSTTSVQLASDQSRSEASRTVAAPPNDQGKWLPVLTDFVRSELVRRGPFKPGLDFSYPKDKSRRGFHSGLFQRLLSKIPRRLFLL